MKNGLEEEYEGAYSRLMNKIEIRNENLKFPDDISVIYEKYNEIMISDNYKLKHKLENMFELYYYASSESALDSSFLKFWIFNERFLKEMLGDMKDKKLIKMMNNLLDGYGSSKLNKIKLNSVYNKRNLLVHEIKSDSIEEADKNFVKSIAHRLILFFLIHFKNINNMAEYGNLLENFSVSTKERERNIELLELLNKLEYDNTITKKKEINHLK